MVDQGSFRIILLKKMARLLKAGPEALITGRGDTQERGWNEKQKTPQPFGGRASN
jgi:hypothetical protein